MARPQRAGGGIYAALDSTEHSASGGAATAFHRGILARRNRAYHGNASRHREIATALREAIVAKTFGGKRTMKTPREYLFDKHRAAETKLDAMRENVVATKLSSAPPIGNEDWRSLLLAF